MTYFFLDKKKPVESPRGAKCSEINTYQEVISCSRALKDVLLQTHRPSGSRLVPSSQGASGFTHSVTRKFINGDFTFQGHMPFPVLLK